MKKEKSNRVVRKPYERVRVTFETDGPSKTHQSHKDSCDVNQILARYERTGMLPPSRSVGQFGDVTGLQGDLTERAAFAQSTVSTARRDVYEYREKKREEARKAKATPVGAGASPTSQVPPGGQPPAGSSST